MFYLRVVLVGVGETLVFRYKGESRASQAWTMLFGAQQSLERRIVNLDDDYGMEARFSNEMISLFTKMDVDQSLKGDAEFEFMKFKLNEGLKKRAGDYVALSTAGRSSLIGQA